MLFDPPNQPGSTRADLSRSRDREPLCTTKQRLIEFVEGCSPGGRAHRDERGAAQLGAEVWL